MLRLTDLRIVLAPGGKWAYSLEDSPALAQI